MNNYVSQSPAEVVQKETREIGILLIKSGPMTISDIALALGMKREVVRRRMLNSGPNAMDIRMKKFRCEDGLWSISGQGREEFS